MKKYFIGLLVITITLTASAFIVSKNISTNAEEKVRKTENAYYWYELLANGKIAGDVLNSGGTDVKSNVIEGGSNQLTDCSDQATPYCLAGCTSSDLHLGDTPDAITMDFDNRIKSDN